MNWLTSGSTASSAPVTGQQAVVNTMSSSPASVYTGAIGQTGITGGGTSPVFSSLSPQANAWLAKSGTGEWLNTVMDAAKQRAGMSGTSSTPGAPGNQGPAGGAARGVVHGMLSARKAPPINEAIVNQQAPAVAPPARRLYQGGNNDEAISAILQQLFSR